MIIAYDEECLKKKKKKGIVNEKKELFFHKSYTTTLINPPPPFFLPPTVFHDQGHPTSVVIGPPDNPTPQFRALRGQGSEYVVVHLFGGQTGDTASNQVQITSQPTRV